MCIAFILPKMFIDLTFRRTCMMRVDPHCVDLESVNLLM